VSILARLHLVAAHQAPDIVGVPAGTVRRWASEKLSDGLPALAPRGHDNRGRPLYAKTDLEALRDRPRRAAHRGRVDRTRTKANTPGSG
jgi:hypothetical protein